MLNLLSIGISAFQDVHLDCSQLLVTIVLLQHSSYSQANVMAGRVLIDLQVNFATN